MGDGEKMSREVRLCAIDQTKRNQLILLHEKYFLWHFFNSIMPLHIINYLIWKFLVPPKKPSDEAKK